MKNLTPKNWFLIIVIIVLLLLLKGCGFEKLKLQTQNAKLQEDAKTNKDFGQFYLNQFNETIDKYDSLKNRSVALEQQNSILEQSAIKSKNALIQLQKSSKRPQYINELQPCNDTLQKVYEYSIQKDSFCNKTISQLDSVIVGKNEIIKNDKATISLAERQKGYLLSANEKHLMAIDVQDKIIENDKKLIRKEQNKKTFWQVVAGILTVLKFIK